jgi:hypothetical protein
VIEARDAFHREEHEGDLERAPRPILGDVDLGQRAWLAAAAALSPDGMDAL